MDNRWMPLFSSCWQSRADPFTFAVRGHWGIPAWASTLHDLLLENNNNNKHCNSTPNSENAGHQRGHTALHSFLRLQSFSHFFLLWAHKHTKSTHAHNTHTITLSHTHLHEHAQRLSVLSAGEGKGTCKMSADWGEKASCHALPGHAERVVLFESLSLLSVIPCDFFRADQQRELLTPSQRPLTAFW